MNSPGVWDDLQLNIVKATIIYANTFKYLIHGCDFRNDVKLSIPWALVPGTRQNAVGGMVCEKQVLLSAHSQGQECECTQPQLWGQLSPRPTAPAPLGPTVQLAVIREEGRDTVVEAAGMDMGICMGVQRRDAQKHMGVRRCMGTQRRMDTLRHTAVHTVRQH